MSEKGLKPAVPVQVAEPYIVHVAAHQNVRNPLLCLSTLCSVRTTNQPFFLISPVFPWRC